MPETPGYILSIPMLFFGALCVGIAINDLWEGRSVAFGKFVGVKLQKSHMTRQSHPVAFWLTVLVMATSGGAFIAFGALEFWK